MTQAISEEATASAIRAHEDLVRERLQTHRAAWGDGPPYFSEGSFAFWQAVKQGRFCLGRCSVCKHVYFPPRVVCSACWAEDAVELAETPALGKLVSYTDVHVVADVLRPLAPLRIAVIDLDEGVRVLTWLRGAGADTTDTADTPAIGAACRISVESIEGTQRFIAQLVKKETNP